MPLLFAASVAKRPSRVPSTGARRQRIVPRLVREVPISVK